MKKYMISLLLVGFSVLTAQASERFKLGLSGGVDVAKFSTQNKEYNNLLSPSPGWYLGAKAELNLFLGLHVEGAAYYQQNKQKVELKNVFELSRTKSSIHFPIHAKYNIDISDFGIYVSTGPQFSYNLKDDKMLLKLGDKFLNASSLDKEDVLRDVFTKENMTIKWNFGVGVRLTDNIEVGLNYTHPLTKEGKMVLDKLNIPEGKQDKTQANYSLQATFYF